MKSRHAVLNTFDLEQNYNWYLYNYFSASRFSHVPNSYGFNTTLSNGKRLPE